MESPRSPRVVQKGTGKGAGPKFLDPGDYFGGIASYLDKHRVYETFDFLAKELLAAKPDNPTKFLISLLKNAKKATQKQRILVLGASLKDNELYSRKIADEFGLHRIRADRIASEEEIYDSIKESNDKGWVMTGYPTSPEQSFKILEENIILSKIIIVQPKGEFDDTGYHLFLSTICDPFPRSLCTVLQQGSSVQESTSLDTILAKISSKTGLLDKVKPRPPPKVIIYSAREAGLGHQGERLADKIGVPYINMVGLIKDGGNLKKAVSLMRSRVSQEDVKRCGFVMSLFADMDVDIPTLLKILDMIPGKTHVLELKSDHPKPLLDRMTKAFPSWAAVEPGEDAKTKLSQALVLELENLL